MGCLLGSQKSMRHLILGLGVQAPSWYRDYFLKNK